MASLLPTPTDWVPGKPLAFNLARSAELLRIRAGSRHTDSRSQLALDVLIPAAEGDWDVLGVTIQGVRRNLAHPVGTIWGRGRSRA